MKRSTMRWVAMILLAASVFFFVMGLTHPILETGYSIASISISHDFIYISDSFRYFTNKGDWFIGGLLLFFTIIFPIIKYIFLALTLSGVKLPKQRIMGTALDMINKWAMLDVFVVAVLILNLKMDSDMVISEMQSGTIYFAISILLMMICSFINQRLIRVEKED
jgi:paraquat-inducible protein A